MAFITHLLLVISNSKRALILTKIFWDKNLSNAMWSFIISSNFFLITESPHLHITKGWKTVFNQTTSKINTSEDASDEDVKDLVLEWMIRVEQKVKHKKSSKLLTKVLYVSKLKPTICRYCKNEAKFAVMLFLWYFKW